MSISSRLLSEQLSPSASEKSKEFTRLHITPLDPELLPVLIPSALLPSTRNISFHSIETFPERRYGFIDLPAADADRLRKKLNGAVLRGIKLRVELARTESIPVPASDINCTMDTANSKIQKSKSKHHNKSGKRKRDGDGDESGVTIEGVELRDRKVKRGWTSSEGEMIKEKREKAKRSKDKDKKSEKRKKKEQKSTKSKYTDGPECLFKQKISEPSTVNGSSSNQQDDETKHKRKKRKSDHEVVIHEFEKTVKHPSFLKSSATISKSSPSTFEEGRGWVDPTGNVVEAIRSKKNEQSLAPVPSTEHGLAEDESDTSSSGTSSDEDEKEQSESRSGSENENGIEHELDQQETVKPTPKAHVKKLSIVTSVASSPVTVLRTDSSRPRSSGSAQSLSIKIPPVTPAAAKVHPLEALYKRQPPGAGTSEATGEAKPFNFFDDNSNDEGKEGADPALATSRGPPPQFPMTPFTKQDFEFRGLRSAAPTPDTAHPSRLHTFPRSVGGFDTAIAEDDEDDDEDDDDEDGDDDSDDDDDKDEKERPNEQDNASQVEVIAPTTTGTGSNAIGEQPKSEFETIFWEQRGDLNRAWKKRRKTAMKEKRNRENRARGARAI